MKAGPLVAMLCLIGLGVWLVLQPALSRKHFDFEVRIGAVQLRAERAEDGYRFVSPPELAGRGVVSAEALLDEVESQRRAWRERPAFERTLLGFLNITSWKNFVWVAVGLGGQAAFFGRMLVQGLVREHRGESVVPELFWWLSLGGGACLFLYFVWRVDIVGVLGQSTGVVIYARNLRLIVKQKRRLARVGGAGEGRS